MFWETVGKDIQKSEILQKIKKNANLDEIILDKDFLDFVNT